MPRLHPGVPCAALALVSFALARPPAPAGPAPVTPVLAAGQTWTMKADVPVAALPGAVTFTLGASRAVGRGGAAFQPTVTSAGHQRFQDDMFYDPEDSDPVFITATRLISQPAGKVPPASYSCLVRTPHARLNEAQRGLFVTGDLMQPATVRAAQLYINTGALTGQPTCTLTRTR
ncbi:hypothetical protein [Deinococcus sp. RIT780]|uniref:hypothetical protein n=1 Tax=Deinococcus sp. RIT780 TaxID=2870472 RepID=UPI001C8A1CC6|nr:hypothetical protein [Deinococcus sp. RIT780]MBX8466156.1 hypothetical protein [Deinococcus sp. RIT780]